MLIGSEVQMGLVIWWKVAWWRRGGIYYAMYKQVTLINRLTQSNLHAPTSVPHMGLYSLQSLRGTLQ
jgi:hypothetical protein